MFSKVEGSSLQRDNSRKLENDKIILSELGRMLHVVNAAEKERILRERCNNSPENDQVHREKPIAADDRRNSQGKKNVERKKLPNLQRKVRHSKKGGSVWVLLKGGFDSKQVPMANTHSKSSNAHGQGKNTEIFSLCENRALHRLHWNLQKRLEALESAEAYIESAWREAEKGELLVPRSKINSNVSQQGKERMPTEEGKEYLMQQYQVASQMLFHSNDQGALFSLVQQTSGNRVAAPNELNRSTAIEQHIRLHSEQWKNVLQREKEIKEKQFNEVDNGKCVVSNEEIRKEVERNWVCITEKLASGKSSDISATKCFIRLRNSQRQKHSSILNSQKAAKNFATGIIKVLRKELTNNSVLPRSGKDDALDSENVSSLKVKTSAKQPAEQKGKHSSKRAGKRKK